MWRYIQALVKDNLNCGNLYMNRDIVGAVVESQPFGGHGLSGNGTKAGAHTRPLFGST
jgi:RHH-type proline utilization regulon transcriptional repressor/proline dehydrogenase/delta 1-pyrroline-5-carboxylate dehydrogenase